MQAFCAVVICFEQIKVLCPWCDLQSVCAGDLEAYPTNLIFQCDKSFSFSPLSMSQCKISFFFGFYHLRAYIILYLYLRRLGRMVGAKSWFLGSVIGVLEPSKVNRRQRSSRTLQRCTEVGKGNFQATEF